VIRTESLSVSFGRTKALANVDLELTEGVVGLFGPNGSGKSTLLRTVCGLEHPTVGRVLVGGRPVSLADESFRRRIGYAGHEPGLYARLTLQENLTLFARLYDLPDARARAVLNLLGLEHSAGVRAGDLSAGTKRRAAVARALLHEPEVLLLDEPYANLDDDAAALASNAISAWNQPGRVALVATHGAKRLKAFASSGVILKQGRVVVHGVYRDPLRAGSGA
jgi:heme ABC exporter ATP-binding subunit CcmA